MAALILAAALLGAQPTFADDRDIAPGGTLPKGKPDVLAAVNRFIDDVRASGLLQRAIDNSGVVGLEPAPAGSWQPSVPD